MTSSEAFVETMVAHGTKNIFGIVGSAFMDALDIFEPAGIRFVPVQVSISVYENLLIHHIQQSFIHLTKLHCI